MLDFSKKLEVIAKNTDSFLKKFFSKQEKNSYLIQPMKYGIFSGGKRFRATIIFNTGKIFNINYDILIPVCAAVECIHSYSLIHDDLPSMDNDEFRRGMLSTHKKFGESTAILAGNSLLTSAYEILSSNTLSLPENIKVELIHELSRCSGHSGIAGGQYLDLSFENKKNVKKDIINMQNKKTGKLFGFCCESVTIINEESEKTRNLFKSIGQNIGLLFQITDDLLDVQEDRSVLKNRTKKDIKKNKATLLNTLGHKQAVNFAKKIKKNLEEKIKKYGTKGYDLLESIEFILTRKY